MRYSLPKPLEKAFLLPLLLRFGGFSGRRIPFPSYLYDLPARWHFVACSKPHQGSAITREKWRIVAVVNTVDAGIVGLFAWVACIREYGNPVWITGNSGFNFPVAPLRAAQEADIVQQDFRAVTCFRDAAFGHFDIRGLPI